MDGRLHRLGHLLARFSERWVPDAFVFAILLTGFVYLLALIFGAHGPLQLIRDWYAGFWNLLQFAMQMTLILVTGYALASSPAVRRGLAWLARQPRSGPGAVALTALSAGALGWIHWGLGLVAGALLAREVGLSARRRGLAVHFPLVAAAGYVGLLVWHSGLSGSAPLLVNTPGHFLEARLGLVPLEQTLFRPFNLVFVAATLAAAALLLAAMHPRGVAVTPIEAAGTDELPAHDGKNRTDPIVMAPADRLAHSRTLVLLIVAAGFIFLVPFFARTGLVGLDLNVLNFTFLMLGLLLHGTLASYAAAAAAGARAASGVIVQFPFYAGIMGLMSESGLVSVIAGWFIAISTPVTYPFWTMVSAAAVNFAVPSGGGQWAIQGPIVMEASQALGVEAGRSIMAVALGDQLTNMIQPFWALPLLGITGLRAGQVLGYTAAVMMVAFVLAALVLLLLP
jgi:short-chain fatty acids transporter